MRLQRSPSTLIQCSLILAAIGLCSRPAWGRTLDAQQMQETASTSASSLPDAPSRLTASRSPVGDKEADHPLDQEEHPRVSVGKLPIYVVRDGVNIVVSPAYIRRGDLKWILPLAGAAAAAFATDEKAMTEVVTSNPSFNQTNINVSDAIRDGFIAAPIGMFAIGQLRHKERMRETGLLGSEALADSFIVDELVKLCTFRERPLVDKGQGEFYIGDAGPDSSFVSGHSMIAWSSAAVIAGEYHSKWAQVGVYSAATGVSLTRVLGQQHFPSDVLLGAAGGWLIGHYVFRAHHHREVAESGH